MIYICYGMTKSASTYLYQLIEQVFEVAHRRPVILGRKFRPYLTVDNYFDDIDPDLLRSIANAVGPRDVVLKTHQRLHPEIADLVEAGTVLACATLRDPREIALSMLDHGRRSRQWRIPEFSELHALSDTFATLDYQIENFRSWARLRPVGVYTFNEICFDTSSVVDRLAEQIGVTVSSADVLRAFKNKHRIGQFNKGLALRYTEMALADQTAFLERYASLYEDYAFDSPAAVQAAAHQAGHTKRPRGQLSQEITFYRRWLQKITRR